MRTRASSAWSDVGSPGSHATSFHTCQVLRPRRAVWVLAFTRPSVLPSAFATASAPGITIFARLNGWPVCSSTDASPPSSRATAHGSRPMWLATPSSYRTCTDYSLPVSRRTAKVSVRYPALGFLTRSSSPHIAHDLCKSDGGPTGEIPYLVRFRREKRTPVNDCRTIARRCRKLSNAGLACGGPSPCGRGGAQSNARVPGSNRGHETPSYPDRTGCRAGLP